MAFSNGAAAQQPFWRFPARAVLKTRLQSGSDEGVVAIVRSIVKRDGVLGALVAALALVAQPRCSWPASLRPVQESRTHHERQPSASRNLTRPPRRNLTRPPRPSGRAVGQDLGHTGLPVTHREVRLLLRRPGPPGVAVKKSP